MPDSRVVVTYRVIGERADIEARAEAIALEQSVELPLVAVREARVRDEVVARVEKLPGVVKLVHSGLMLDR